MLQCCTRNTNKIQVKYNAQSMKRKYKGYDSYKIFGGLWLYGTSDWMFTKCLLTQWTFIVATSSIIIVQSQSIAERIERQRHIKPHLLYGSEVIGWNNSEQCLILYTHSIVPCVGSTMLTSSYCPLCTITLGRQTFVIILYVGVINF